MDRILARKRDFELDVDSGYYAVVNEAYERFFQRYHGRKLRVPMDEWDFVKEPGLYARLAELVDRVLDTK